MYLTLVVLTLLLQEAEQQLSLERDPWRVVESEQQVATGVGAAGTGPEQFVEQELIVEPEPDEDELEESGQQQSEVQRYVVDTGLGCLLLCCRVNRAQQQSVKATEGMFILG